MEGGEAALHTPSFFCPLLPRWRGRRGLGDERVIAYGRNVNPLCTIPKVPFATWQGWLNSYVFNIILTSTFFVGFGRQSSANGNATRMQGRGKGTFLWVLAGNRRQTATPPACRAGGRGLFCGFWPAGAARRPKPLIFLPLPSVFAGEGAGGGDIFSQHTVLTELNGSPHFYARLALHHDGGGAPADFHSVVCPPIPWVDLTHVRHIQVRDGRLDGQDVL